MLPGGDDRRARGGTVRRGAWVASPDVPALEVPADAVLPERHAQAPAPGERMRPHNAHCLGCGDVPGGLRVEAWAEQGMGVRARFRARPEHQGGPGVLHGGILVTALDEALGFVPTLVHRAAVTARLETDFRSPVPVDSDVWVLAALEGAAGRKFYVSGTAHLHTPEGPVVATARALFLRVDAEHFLRHGRAEDLEALGASADAVRAARA